MNTVEVAEEHVVLSVPIPFSVLEVLVPGVQGTQGLPGSSYSFTQTIPAILWNINHNLGFYPAVTLYTIGGVIMAADVIQISLNQATVHFVIPTAGTARLN